MLLIFTCWWRKCFEFSAVKLFGRCMLIFYIWCNLRTKEMVVHLSKQNLEMQLRFEFASCLLTFFLLENCCRLGKGPFSKRHWRWNSILLIFMFKLSQNMGYADQCFHDMCGHGETHLFLHFVVCWQCFCFQSRCMGKLMFQLVSGKGHCCPRTGMNGLMFAISANVGKCFVFFRWMVVWGQKFGLKRWCIAGGDTDQRKTQDT